MANREFVVCELVSTYTCERPPVRCRVLFWDDYGVVIPQLVTTNGSVVEAAQYLYGHVAIGTYKVENLTIPELDFTSEPALRRTLRDAYTRWNVTGQESKS